MMKTTKIQANINKGIYKYNMHLGKGPFVVTPWIHVVDSCQNEYQKPQKGVLGLGRMRWMKTRVGELIEM
jgi:hypothetical protein